MSAWLAVLSATIASYGWWGSDHSPLRFALYVTMASISSWAVLRLIEARMFGAIEKVERTSTDA